MNKFLKDDLAELCVAFVHYGPDWNLTEDCSELEALDYFLQVQPFSFPGASRLA